MHLFATILMSILFSVDALKVANFLKEREHYDLGIEQRAPRVPPVTIAQYMAGMYRTLLKNLV